MPIGIYQHKPNQGFQKGNKFIPWNKGKTFSDESKIKMSNSQKGRIHSEETREKIKMNNARYWLNKKRPDISKMQKGKIFSPATIEKLRISHLGNKSNWKGGVSFKEGYVAFMARRRKSRKKQNGGSHTFIEWEALKMKYRYMCLCCKKSEPEIKLTQDHIIPISKGGSDDLSNIQPLCMRCNNIKRTKTTNYLGSILK